MPSFLALCGLFNRSGPWVRFFFRVVLQKHFSAFSLIFSTRNYFWPSSGNSLPVKCCSFGFSRDSMPMYSYIGRIEKTTISSRKYGRMKGEFVFVQRGAVHD